MRVGPINGQVAAQPVSATAPWYNLSFAYNSQSQPQRPLRQNYDLVDPTDAIFGSAIFRPRQSLLDQLSGIPSDTNYPNSTNRHGLHVSQYHQQLLLQQQQLQQQQLQPSQLQYNIKLDNGKLSTKRTGLQSFNHTKGDGLLNNLEDRYSASEEDDHTLQNRRHRAAERGLRRDTYSQANVYDKRDIETQTPLPNEYQGRVRVSNSRQARSLASISDQENQPPRKQSTRPSQNSLQHVRPYHSDQESNQQQGKYPPRRPSVRQVVQSRRGGRSTKRATSPIFSGNEADDSGDELLDPSLMNLNGDYEGGGGNNQVVNRKGRLVTFYRNGDRYFPGLTTAVNKRMFTVFETLLVWLGEKISTPSGVKHIFRIPDGQEITELDEFEAGKSYVVSSVQRFSRLPYGNIDLSWYNTRPSASR